MSQQLPPPPNLSLPPPPPSAGVVLSPPVTVAPPGPPLSRASLSKAVLLTHLPKVLQDKSRLRSWLVEVTGIRHILLCPPQSNANRNNADGVNSENNNKTNDMFSLFQLPDETKTTFHALVTCTHPEGAMKLVSVLRQFWKTETSDKEESTSLAAAHWIPTQANLPLPPPTSFPDYSTELMENLSATLKTCLERLETNNNTHRSAMANSSSSAPTTIAPTTPSNAGGGDENMVGDDQEDPLENPAVLEAVRQFRQSLEHQQGSKAVRRKELVLQKIQSALERVRQNPPPEAPHNNLPPPPVPLPAQELPLPPPPGLQQQPPQGAPPRGVNPRGVSNLPAWMTQQPPEGTTAAPPPPPPELPPAKKQKTNSLVDLKQWIGSEIQNLLGEPEASLVDFIYDHATSAANRPIQDLLPELKDVLDEDAPAFLQKLENQMKNLQQERE